MQPSKNKPEYVRRKDQGETRAGSFHGRCGLSLTRKRCQASRALFKVTRGTCLPLLARTADLSCILRNNVLNPNAKSASPGDDVLPIPLGANLRSVSSLSANCSLTDRMVRVKAVLPISACWSKSGRFQAF
eukprot:1262574-Amphidinium_carterae.1